MAGADVIIESDAIRQRLLQQIPADIRYGD
jgi:hypothetical protein